MAHKVSIDQFVTMFSPLFGDAGASVQRTLPDLLRFLTFEKDTVVVERGKVGNSLYLIYKGRLGVYSSVRDRTLQIAEIGPGQWFGETTFLEADVGSADVIALEETTVVELTWDNFERLIEEHPKTASHVIQGISIGLANRLRRSSAGLWAVMESGDLQMRVPREKSAPQPSWIRNVWGNLFGHGRG